MKKATKTAATKTETKIQAVTATAPAPVQPTLPLGKVKPANKAAAKPVKKTAVNDRKDNPFKPGSVSAALFDAMAKPAEPRTVCKAVAKKFGKGEEQVWQTYEVLRTPAHSSNKKRSKAVAGTIEGTVQLVAMK